MVENASNVVVCHRVVRVFGTIPLVPPFYGARLRIYQGLGTMKENDSNAGIYERVVSYCPTCSS